MYSNSLVVLAAASLLFVFFPVNGYGSGGGAPVPTVPGQSILDHFKPVKFDESYDNLWGAQNQELTQNGDSVILKLDRSSGSGFKSREGYMYGIFNAAMKLQGGYTGGIVTSFYLSNNQERPTDHNEVDFEFIGTVPGEPYTLQTNLYGNGTGDGPFLIGREQQFRLRFDPTKDFHNYTIVWTPLQIIWLVDGIPVRRFRWNKSVGAVYPSRPMSVYASIWDASSNAWATKNGTQKVDYSLAPFVSQYSNFVTAACPNNGSMATNKVQQLRCRSEVGALFPLHLTPEQENALKVVRQHYMTYNYCNHTSLPECLHSHRHE